MSQFPSSNLRRSLVSPNLPTNPSQKYRISKRNNSMFQQKPSPPPLISTPQILQLCSSSKNYDTLSDTQVKYQNRKLKQILRQLNAQLTYRVERKKVRYENGNQSVSMKELMEYIPKDFEEEERRNQETIEELRKELEGEMRRKKVVQNIAYRNQLEDETERLTKMKREMEESIRAINRMFILKEKQIKALEKESYGQDMFMLRRELNRATKHVEQLEAKLEETQLQNNKIYQKTLIISTNYTQLQTEYNEMLTSKKQQELKILQITQNNDIYLDYLNKLKNSKRRYHTLDEICKVKYYNALKKLEVQAEKVDKVVEEVKQLEYQIYLKRELGERIATRLEEKELKEKLLYFEEGEVGERGGSGGGFMITEIENGRKSHKSRKSYSQHSQTVKSVKMGEGNQSKYQSLYY